MKATLEFNLPEEQTEHRAAVQALDWKYVVSEMDEYLRSQIKYQELPEEANKALQAARDHLHELCNDNNVNIHE
jgi:hypothetical protein